MLAIGLPSVDVNQPRYQTVPAIYRKLGSAECGPLSYAGMSGTGGFEGEYYLLNRKGYTSFYLLKMYSFPDDLANAPYAEQMLEVKSGFGRTMSRLPAVFGVSRQTLYNWMNGETPKEHHQQKLEELTAAARVFIASGFTPSGQSLDRTVAQGKSFVQLIAQGASGKETAEKLIRIERQGTYSRSKLDSLLGDRKSPRPDVSDMGRPALNENV